MLDKKIKDWLKKEMIMSKVSDQMQIKTCIYNDTKITYAFVGGLPIQYCYFVAVMLSTYTDELIPYDDYYKIIDILDKEWDDVVDIAHYRKKFFIFQFLPVRRNVSVFKSSNASCGRMMLSPSV